MKRILIILLVSVGGLTAQQVGQEFIVRINDFSGGLNVAGDSINMSPNQMVTADNLVLDRFGALHKRHGVGLWNHDSIGSYPVDAIEYVEDKNGSKNLYVASGHHVYQMPGWSDSSLTWEGRQIKYRRGKIDTTTNSGQKYIYGDTNSWVLTIAPGDKIRLQGGGAYYVIDSVLADTCLHVSANITVVGDTFAGYQIYKYVAGTPQLSSWNGKLYVADPQNDPWWYDGTTPRLLAVVDSGTVDTVVNTVATLAAVSPSGWIQFRGNLLQYMQGGDFDTTFNDGSATDTIGTIITIIGGSWNFGGHSFRGRVTRVVAANMLELDRSPTEPCNWQPYLLGCGNPNYSILYLDASNDSTIYVYGNCRWSMMSPKTSRSSTNKNYIVDTAKNWDLVDYTGMFLAAGKDATKANMIVDNQDDFIAYDSTIDMTKGERYYVVWQLPSLKFVHLRSLFVGRWPDGRPYWYWNYRDSLAFGANYYNQIIFHRNRLYGIGNSIVPTTSGDATQGDSMNTNLVWFSEIGLPYMIHPSGNFDVTGAGSTGPSQSLFSEDACAAMFQLSNNLYVATNSNIYRVSGEPVSGAADLTVQRIAQGIGTLSPKSVVTTAEALAYIMNRDGIWRFDGYTAPVKISLPVQPLCEAYRNCSMVAGKWKDELYFSYPESSKTLVYNLVTKGFTQFTFGMNTINSQSISSDSNYFLFACPAESGAVHIYPARNNRYYDDFRFPMDSNKTQIYFTYRTGYFNPSQFNQVRLENANFTASKGGMEAIGFDVYDNFSGTATQNDTLGVAANHKTWRWRGEADCYGDFLSVKISTSASFSYADSTGDFIISEIGLKCVEKFAP